MMADVRIDGIQYVPKTKRGRKKKRSLPELTIEVRELRGETLEEAAHHIGTSKSHLRTLECGNALPRLDMLQRILEHFDIDFYDIRSATPQTTVNREG